MLTVSWSNFKNDEEVGWALLEMLIYYNYEQVQVLAQSVFKKFKRNIWISEFAGIYQNASANINNMLNEKLKGACFIPLEENNVGSAFSLTNVYKKIKDFSAHIKFYNVLDIPILIALKHKYIVFFDDIIGTGTQFTKFWDETKHFKNFDITLNDIAALNPDINFYYLVLSASEDTLEKLNKKYENITIITAEKYYAENSVLSLQNEYWDMRPYLKDVVINYLNKKMEELKIRNPFGLNMPILFQHCRAPNTSLPLYWHGKNAWNELYKR